MEFPTKKLESFWQRVRQAFTLFFDKEVPWFYKLIPITSIVYLLFPLDFVSDYIPVLGQLDDLTLMGGALALFAKLANDYKKDKKVDEKESKTDNEG